MLEQVGHFIGMAAADVVHFFRGRQAVPCLVDWELVAEMERVRALYAADGRPDVQAVFKRAVQGDQFAQAALAEVVSARYGQLENPAADDCCRSCDNGCWSDDPTA